MAAPVKPMAVYVSTDGKYTFDILEKTGDETMKLKDESTGKTFLLSRSPSSRGVKYSSDDDYFFWIKGDDFMWGKGDSLYTSGKIKK
jgi:membrane-bound inhibitor of C-type lysozyme